MVSYWIACITLKMICFSYGMVHYVMVGPDFQGVCVLLKLPSVGIMCSFSIILYLLVSENSEIAVKKPFSLIWKWQPKFSQNCENLSYQQRAAQTLELKLSFHLLLAYLCMLLVTLWLYNPIHLHTLVVWVELTCWLYSGYYCSIHT